MNAIGTSESARRDPAPRFTHGLKLAGVFFVTLVFVLIVAHYVGWRELISAWSALPLALLPVAVCLVLATHVIRTARLRAYFPVDIGGRFLGAYRLMLQHNLFNNFMPMRTGELAFPILMQRDFSVSIERSVPALLWFRLLDLHALLLIAVIAAGSIGLHLEARIILLLALLPLPLFAQRLRDWLYGIVCARPVAGGLRGLMARVLAALPGSRRVFWLSWWWTIANWTVKLAALGWVLHLFAAVPIGAAVLGVVGGEATSVLPIHGVAGVGTYEAGIMGALLPVHQGAPTSLLAAAVNLHLFLLGTTLLGGLVSLFLPRSGGLPRRS